MRKTQKTQKKTSKNTGEVKKPLNELIEIALKLNTINIQGQTFKIKKNVLGNVAQLIPLMDRLDDLYSEVDNLFYDKYGDDFARYKNCLREMDIYIQDMQANSKNTKVMLINVERIKKLKDTMNRDGRMMTVKNHYLNKLGSTKALFKLGSMPEPGSTIETLNLKILCNALLEGGELDQIDYEDQTEDFMNFRNIMFEVFFFIKMSTHTPI